MAYNNQNNNNNNEERNEKSVNTTSFQLYNANSFDPSTVVFGLWNGNVSIRFHPALEANKRTEVNVFNYEQSYSTAISLDKACILFKGLKEVIFPALEKEEIASIGVPVGADNLFVIGTGFKDSKGFKPYIALFKNVDTNTLKPGFSIYFEFNIRGSINNYDPTSGAFEEKNNYNEIYTFALFLETAIKGLFHSYTHSQRYVKFGYDNMIADNIKRMAESMGLSASSGRSSYSRGNAFSGRGNSSGQSVPKDDDIQAVEQFENIDELNSLMQMS
ncbi:MAG: hypothetical protein PHF63_00530 [Herbinix sp.]|nr:hypothetical protein [Herbinix sp.]